MWRIRTALDPVILFVITIFTNFFVYTKSVTFCRTGMTGVPGTASDIFAAVKDVGANVIMISQVN